MKVKDFVINSIYRGTNQKLQTVMMGRDAVVNALNFALGDIYSYQWKERTFMYWKETLTWDTTTDKNIELSLSNPIKKLVFLKPITATNITQAGATYIPQHAVSVDWLLYQTINTEPTEGVDDLSDKQVYFKPRTTKLWVPNNTAGYILHYISSFSLLTWEDDIPLPDIFLGVLYNLTMTYLYPITGEYGDNKDANSHTKAKDQLVNLAKADSFQTNQITWNIN